MDIIGLVVACLGLSLALLFTFLRRAPESERLAEISGRLASLSESLNMRLDAQGRTSGEVLKCLAVMDAAQQRLTDMAGDMISLKDILANKQTRGAFGQGRMETIIGDALPANTYTLQATLPNNARPDCLIHLPGDKRSLVVDAKFPLEGFSAFHRAHDDESQNIAMRRVRQDLGRHIADISEKYLLPGVTQDVALMFVPSESIYADLVEHFDDIVQRAHRAHVVIVSPSLLMMAVHVAKMMLRDMAVRDSLHTIQEDIGKLLADCRRLGERANKLENHFRATQEDLAELLISNEKIIRRAARIENMDFGAKG